MSAARTEPDLDRALAASNSGIVIADATRPDLPLTFVNPAFERLTGYTSEECLGRNCRFLQGPDTDPDTVEEIRRALRREEELHVVLLNYRKDGTSFHNELRMSPVRDESGTVVQVVGVQHDVSTHVRAHRRLLQERDSARVTLDRLSETVARQEHELTELRTLQAALTPAEPPRRDGMQLAHLFSPAEHGVSGDFYLVAPGQHNRTVIAIGDVMGHGLKAARRATFARTALANFARFTDDPRRLLEMTNHLLIERTGERTEFLTVMCATIDPATRVLRWSAAGHLPPLRLDSGEPVGDLEAVGTPLGIDIDIGATSAECVLPARGGIVAFTDGLTEARSARDRGTGAPFGERAVADSLRVLRGGEPAGVVEGLRIAAAHHTGGSFADDLCILALRLTD